MVALCQCGCGNPAPIRYYTIKARGMFRGTAARFILGHNGKITTPRGENHYAWLGDKASAESKRCRIRKVLKLKKYCERCRKSKATDRHHKDGNPGNNVTSNIAHLCRKCHMVLDGRLAKFAALPKPLPLPPRACLICKGMAVRFWKGRCHACNEYLRRNGIERSEYLQYAAKKRAARK